jgi:protocatechuate 3,4-dioxygenase beta subunit
MTTQTPAPQVELIVLADARTLPRMREGQVRRLRRHLVRTGRSDWSVSVASDADHLDSKALRHRFADRDASVVVFVRLDSNTDLDALLAPVLLHTAPAGLDRRTALKQAVGAVGGLAFLAACGSKTASTTASTSGSTSPPTTATPTTAASIAAPTTNAPSGSVAPSSSTSVATAAPETTATPLAAETTEGPYYLDLNNVRRDIREDRKGAQFDLSIAVVDAAGAPIAGAAVDIWHCDAEGTYSGFASASASGNGGGGAGRGPGSGGPPPGAGGPPPGGGNGPAGDSSAESGNRTVQVATPGDSSTFLRGTQIADATGKVSFTTVFPGWYQGRTVHVHVLAHVGGKVVHVGQIFFDDAFTDDVFANNAPYSSRPARGQRNANDGIFSQAGGVISPATKSGSGYAAAVTMAIKR